MIRMTPASSPTNCGLCVGKVPAERDSNFFCASEPATASKGTTLELLAEIFGSAPDHESSDKHRDNREGEDAVKAGAAAAENNLAELQIDQRDHAAERQETVVR